MSKLKPIKVKVASLKQRYWTKANPRTRVIEVTALIVVLTAVGYVLIPSFAATASVSKEAEDSTRTSVTLVNDSQASGGQAIQFGATTPPCEVTNTCPPPPPPGSGLWLSQAEINALPASGSAYDKVVSAANSVASGSAPQFNSNTTTHDVNTLAAALLAAKGNAAMRAKVESILVKINQAPITGTGTDGGLHLGRNLQGYVIAADLIGYRTSAFQSELRRLTEIQIDGHSGASTLRSLARQGSNNWGSHARASMALVGLYLNDQAMIDEAVTAWRGYVGDSVSHQIRWSSTNWHASNPKAGINRRGTVKEGRNIDGTVPEEMRRGDEFSANPWPPAPQNYAYGALAAELVAGTVLSRAGKVSVNAGDQALRRAYTWLFNEQRFPPDGDDTWQPWLANKVLGTNFATTAASPGKNMGWTDWTHAR